MSKYMVNKGLKGILILDAVKLDLNPGQVFNLTEDQLKDNQVKISIRQGYISLVESVEKEKIVVDKKLTSVKIAKKVEIKPEEVEEVEEKTNMSSWDAYNGKLADKEASAKLVSEQMKSNKQKKVQKGDVDFKKGEIVKKKRVRKSKKNAKEVKKETKLNKSSKKSKINRIFDEAVEEVDVAFVDSNKKVEELSFVDQEQEAERLKRHPILSKKNKDIVQQNGDVS